MRRCKDIQGGGLILAVCLCAGVALADIWPSWLSPAQGSYDRGNQAMSGAVERLTVSVGPDAWTNYITTNIWAGYFSQASKLRASKNMFKAALNGATWVRPVTNYTPETAQTVTESNILAWCGAPAGWWTNHPYVNIANSSNGWRFLPDVASNLVWVITEKTIDFTDDLHSYSLTYWSQWAGDYMQVGFGSCDYAYSNRVYYDDGEGAWGVVPEQMAYYQCDFRDISNVSILVSYNSTSITGELFIAQVFPSSAISYGLPTNVWGKLQPTSQNFFSGDHVNTFTNYGADVSTNWMEYAFIKSNESAVVFFSTPTYGTDYNLDHSEADSFPPKPRGQDFVTYERGWSTYLSEWNAVLKYNATTNGFRWFR